MNRKDISLQSLILKPMETSILKQMEKSIQSKLDGDIEFFQLAQNIIKLITFENTGIRFACYQCHFMYGNRSMIPRKNEEKRYHMFGAFITIYEGEILKANANRINNIINNKDINDKVEIPVLITLDKRLFSGEFTAREITACILHEVGHLVYLYNKFMTEIFHGNTPFIINFKNKIRNVFMNTPTTNVVLKNAKSVKDMESTVTTINALLPLYMVIYLLKSKISIDTEKGADQYALQSGYSKDLASLLTKVNNNTKFSIINMFSHLDRWGGINSRIKDAKKYDTYFDPNSAITQLISSLGGAELLETFTEFTNICNEQIIAYEKFQYENFKIDVPNDWGYTELDENLIREGIINNFKDKKQLQKKLKSLREESVPDSVYYVSHRPFLDTMGDKSELDNFTDANVSDDNCIVAITGFINGIMGDNANERIITNLLRDFELVINENSISDNLFIEKLSDVLNKLNSYSRFGKSNKLNDNKYNIFISDTCDIEDGFTVKGYIEEMSYRLPQLLSVSVDKDVVIESIDYVRNLTFLLDINKKLLEYLNTGQINKFQVIGLIMATVDKLYNFFQFVIEFKESLLRELPNYGHNFFHLMNKLKRPASGTLAYTIFLDIAFNDFLNNTYPDDINIIQYMCESMKRYNQDEIALRKFLVVLKKRTTCLDNYIIDLYLRMIDETGLPSAYKLIKLPRFSQTFITVAESSYGVNVPLTEANVVDQLYKRPRAFIIGDINDLSIKAEMIQTYWDKKDVAYQIHSRLADISDARAKLDIAKEKDRDRLDLLLEYESKLIDILREVMNTKIVEKDFGVFLKYPKGYEG